VNKTLANVVKYRTLYLFLVPALVTVFFFAYRPMIGLIMAFQEFNMKDGWLSSPFVGLMNFANFLLDADFYRALQNTLALGFLNTVVIFPLPIVFALLLNEIKIMKFKRVSQTVSYLPHFVSWIIVTSLVTRFLDFRTGMVNNLLSSFGMDRIGFMREADFFWLIVIVSSIWKGLGWGSIIYLSALSGVNQELYEAAMVDGAGRWKQMVYITLPSIMPTIGLMFVLAVGGMISTGGLFDAVYNLSNPMVAAKAYTLELYVYYQGIIYMRYGYAQAIYLAQSLIALGMVMGANRIYRRLNDDASVF
jgi:putative aldouronate transport system permease protein